MPPQHQQPLEWAYEAQLGLPPDHWSHHFKTGFRQSPINILIDQERCVHSTCCANLAPHSQTTNHSSPSHSSKLLSNYLTQKLTISSPNKAANKITTRRDSLGADSGRDEDLDDTWTSSEASNQISRSNSTSSSPNLEDPIQQPKADSQTTRVCTSNKKIFLGYPRHLGQVHLANTGHSWQINLSPQLSAHTLLCGPPLDNCEYQLAQLHCHWGSSSAHGSEHLINGRSYSAELHFVHWNCSKYANLESASKSKHGLAVLGVMIEALEGEQHRNKHLDKIVAHLGQIHDKDSSTSVNMRLDLKKLFPANRWCYASYEGSLTTPPLSEVVDWVVFLQPITCSSSQIEQFRRLRCHSSGAHMTHNARPVQPTNGRLVTIWSHH